MSTRLFRILAALSGIVGVVLLGVSFNINPGPPANATTAQLVAFANQNFTSILWGAWLQAVGPLLILVFAFAVVCLAGATTRLAGWMTMFGGAVLMMVSLIEITFYIGTLYGISTGLTSGDLIHAVQHLYFIVAAPALFLPLGVVILASHILPRVMGYLALALGAAFAILGIVYLTTLVLPVWVTAFAGIQALWWLAAAIILTVHPGKNSDQVAVSKQEAVGSKANG